MKIYRELLIERIEIITGGERFITEMQLEEINELADVYVEDCGESGTGRGKWYNIYQMNDDGEPTGDELADVVVDVRL